MTTQIVPIGFWSTLDEPATEIQCLCGNKGVQNKDIYRITGDLYCIDECMYYNLWMGFVELSTVNPLELKYYKHHNPVLTFLIDKLKSKNVFLKKENGFVTYEVVSSEVQLPSKLFTLIQKRYNKLPVVSVVCLDEVYYITLNVLL